ncbi:MAG: DTW domain-containing protein [Treponema sp.]|nr:DTW domain-containing protein [Treponema sp.]HAK68120.1 DTW domain-containing protein [Treponema sp.]
MSDICYKCLRPVAACFCDHLKEVDSKVKFVFLMHPKEAKRQRTGTGRLASIRLPGSEILVGVDFTENKRLCELLSDPQYFPVLLYPGDDAWTSAKEGFKETIGNRTLLVIIIDSTWFCSKKMIRLSTNVNTLPKLSFSGSYKSIFTFKREPAEYCVSTIESCYYLIKELQTAGIVEKSVDPEPLMDVFKEMIKYQLSRENERIEKGLPGGHANDWKYTKIKEIPDFDKNS